MTVHDIMSGVLMVSPSCESLYVCVCMCVTDRLIEEVRDAATSVTLVNDEVYMNSRCVYIV